MKKEELLRQFSLHIPSSYEPRKMLSDKHKASLSFRSAAVLIPCIERHGDLSVILTKRASHLKHHPGQVSFPGGKYELFDQSLCNTALREAHEEIGLSPKQVAIFGQLPELMTISQFKVTPFLAFVEPNYQSRIDRNEVDCVFEVPASYLFNPSNLYSEHLKVKGKTQKVFGINYHQHFIWGVTAQIIEALQRQLNIHALASAHNTSKAEISEQVFS